MDAPPGAPIQRLVQVWEDGQPIQKAVAFLPKAQINQLIIAAVSAPYEDPLMLEPEFFGWSKMAVMLHKLATRAAEKGDPVDIEKLLSRILGSPLQKSENVNVNVSYEDKLREIAKAAVDAAKPIIEIRAVPPYEGEDDPLA